MLKKKTTPGMLRSQPRKVRNGEEREQERRSRASQLGITVSDLLELERADTAAWMKRVQEQQEAAKRAGRMPTPRFLGSSSNPDRWR